MSSMKDYIKCIPLKIKHNVVLHKKRNNVDIRTYTQQSSSNNFWTNSDTFDVQYGLKRKLLRKFQSQRQIDLHGYTQDEAFIALLRFFEKCQSDGVKYAIVITGGNALKLSVLRDKFKRWARENFSSFIASFSQANLKDGGQGAFYVVIRTRTLNKIDKLFRRYSTSPMKNRHIRPLE